MFESMRTYQILKLEIQRFAIVLGIVSDPGDTGDKRTVSFFVSALLLPEAFDF